MWFLRVFKMMFLPTTVHEKVSDIWRSYITEYFIKLTGGHVIFTGPYVTQGNGLGNRNRPAETEPLHFTHL